MEILDYEEDNNLQNSNISKISVFLALLGTIILFFSYPAARLTFTIGLWLGIRGLLKKERPIWWAIAGLLLNTLLIVYRFYHSSREVWKLPIN